MVSVAGKYLTGQAATWGEGDWDCAPVPGRKRLNPPVCDGVFDQFDIVAALQTGLYRAPRYAAEQPDVLKDLSIVGSPLGEVNLIYVPEPSAAAFLVLGLFGLWFHWREIRG